MELWLFVLAFFPSDDMVRERILLDLRRINLEFSLTLGVRPEDVASGNMQAEYSVPATVTRLQVAGFSQHTQEFYTACILDANLFNIPAIYMPRRRR